MLHPVSVAMRMSGGDHPDCQIRLSDPGQRMVDIAQPYHPAGVHVPVPMDNLHQPSARRFQLIRLEQAGLYGQGLGSLAVSRRRHVPEID